MERKKEVEISQPVTVAGVTLIPITEVSMDCCSGRDGVSFLGVKKPVAVVVVSPALKTAFRINGEEISLAQLVREVPAVGGLLERV